MPVEDYGNERPPRCAFSAGRSAQTVQRRKLRSRADYLLREVFFGRCGFAGVFWSVCESDFSGLSRRFSSALGRGDCFCFRLGLPCER
jgi:hypothetical protein